jgi:hypothetical protein
VHYRVSKAKEETVKKGMFVVCEAHDVLTRRGAQLKHAWAWSKDMRNTSHQAQHGLAYSARAPCEPVRHVSHPNIKTRKTPQLHDAITTQPWIRFWMRLKQSNCAKTAHLSCTAKLQIDLVSTEHHCCGATGAFEAQMKRWEKHSNYVAHNKN